MVVEVTCPTRYLIRLASLVELGEHGK